MFIACTMGSHFNYCAIFGTTLVEFKITGLCNFAKNSAVGFSCAFTSTAKHARAGQGTSSRHSASLLCCVSGPPFPTLTPPHVVGVFGVCLFGVVLIVGACVFGLCWLGGECARCRADGVPSAPYGLAVPSTLLSHRERRADRLLQGEHHFFSPSLSVSHTQRGSILKPH